MEQELDQCDKKVELSVRKLAKIAARGYQDEESVCNIGSELELIDIQNHVYKAVKVIRKTSMHNEDTAQTGLEKYTAIHYVEGSAPAVARSGNPLCPGRSGLGLGVKYID